MTKRALTSFTNSLVNLGYDISLRTVLRCHSHLDGYFAVRPIPSLSGMLTRKRDFSGLLTTKASILMMCCGRMNAWFSSSHTGAFVVEKLDKGQMNQGKMIYVKSIGIF